METLVASVLVDMIALSTPKALIAACPFFVGVLLGMVASPAGASVSLSGAPEALAAKLRVMTRRASGARSEALTACRRR